MGYALAFSAGCPDSIPAGGGNLYNRRAPDKRGYRG